jgi:hypothetical protein
VLVPEFDLLTMNVREDHVDGVYLLIKWHVLQTRCSLGAYLLEQGLFFLLVIECAQYPADLVDEVTSIFTV